MNLQTLMSEVFLGRLTITWLISWPLTYVVVFMLYGLNRILLLHVPSCRNCKVCSTKFTKVNIILYSWQVLEVGNMNEILQWVSKMGLSCPLGITCSFPVRKWTAVFMPYNKHFLTKHVQSNGWMLVLFIFYPCSWLSQLPSSIHKH